MKNHSEKNSGVGCKSIVHNTDELLLSPLKDGRRWRVRRMFAYWVTPRCKEPTAFRLTVFCGFVTDFASIPRFFWRLLPPWGKYGTAAVLHDYIYAYHNHNGSSCYGISRAYADKIFLWVMEDFRVNVLIRYIMYGMVRAFAFRAWVNSPKRVTKKRRIFK